MTDEEFWSLCKMMNEKMKLSKTRSSLNFTKKRKNKKEKRYYEYTDHDGGSSFLIKLV